jgi:hypothetical protein
MWDLNRQNMFVIIIVLIVAIMILYYWSYVSWWGMETFKKSKATRVTTADGACESRHPSIVDYYTHSYPFYEKNSYFKPLDQLRPQNDDNTLNFERKHYTTLYTSPQ